MGQYITDDELLRDLKSVAEQLGRTPLSKEYSTCGKYSIASFQHRFGNFLSAVKKAGLPPAAGMRTRYSDEELDAHIYKLTAELGRPPTWTDIKSAGGVSVATIERRFGKTDFSEDGPITIDDDWCLDGVSDFDGGYVAGMVNGEGSFGIKRTVGVFSIGLRADDKQILEDIRIIMGIPNTVSTFSNQRRRDTGQVVGDECRLNCSNRIVAYQRIIPFFDRFPLKGRKAFDFSLYKELVSFMYCRDQLLLRRRKLSQEESDFVDELQDRLRASRVDPTSRTV